MRETKIEYLIRRFFWRLIWSGHTSRCQDRAYRRWVEKQKQ